MAASKLDLPNFLKQIFLFKELSQKQREEISSYCKITKLKKNEPLFFQDEDGDHFYLVVYGKLSIFRSSPTGQEQILHIQQENDIVAEAVLFKKMKYPASCKALKESLVVCVRKESFLETMLSNPQMMLKMLSSYSKRLKEFVGMIEYLTLDDVEKRFLKYLQKNLQSPSSPEEKPYVQLPFSKKELAGLLGTTPESISRTLRKLKDQGTLEEDKNRIIINDLKTVKN